MGRSSGGLTALDLSLADCVEAGEVFSLGRFIEQHPDEARHAMADGEFSIHSDIIRRLLEGKPLPGETHARVLTDAGLRIRGRGSNQQDEQNSDDAESRRRRFRDFVDKVRDKTESDEGLFDEVLDLSGITTDHPIELISCHLNGGLKLENSKIRSISLSNSTTAFISAWDMDVSGSFEARGLRCRGRISLANSRIAGDLNFHSLQHLLDKDEEREFQEAQKTRRPPILKSRMVTLGTSEIAGDLFIKDAVLCGTVDMIGAEIGGDFSVEASIICSPLDEAIRAQNSTIGGRIMMRSRGREARFVAIGKIDFLGAEVGGTADLSGSDIISNQPSSILFANASFHDSLLMCGLAVKDDDGNTDIIPFSARPGVSLDNCRIQTDLGLSGAILNVARDGSGSRNALSAQSVRVGGTVYMETLFTNGGGSFPFTTTGHVDFRNSEVGENVQLFGAQILASKDESGTTSRFERIRSLLHRFPARVRSLLLGQPEPVRYSNLTFSGATMRHLRIEQRSQSSLIQGALYLANTTIKNDLVISHTTIGDGTRSISGPGCSIGSDLKIQSGIRLDRGRQLRKKDTPWKTKLLGQLNLHGATLGNDLEIRDTDIVAPHHLERDFAINATGIVVNGAVKFISGRYFRGVRIWGDSCFLNAHVGRNFQTTASSNSRSQFFGHLQITAMQVGAQLILHDIYCTRGINANGVEARQDIDLQEGFRVYGETNLENSVAGQDLILPLTDCRREQKRSTRNFLQSVFFFIPLCLTQIIEGAGPVAHHWYDRARGWVPPARLEFDFSGAKAKTLKANTRLGLRALKLNLDGLEYGSIRFARRRWFVKSNLPPLTERLYHHISNTGTLWALYGLLVRPILFLFGVVVDIRPVRAAGQKLRKLFSYLRNFFLVRHALDWLILPLLRWLAWLHRKLLKPQVHYEQARIGEAKAFLRTQGRGSDAFRRQPYDQLISCLKSGGRDLPPRTIEWMKQERLRKELGPRIRNFQIFWPRHPMRWLYLSTLNVLAGHGLKISRTMTWMLVLMVFGFWTFESANEVNMMKVYDSAPRVRIAQDVARLPSPQYPHFSGALYTADVFVPLLDLHQENYWIPGPFGILENHNIDESVFRQVCFDYDACRSLQETHNSSQTPSQIQHLQARMQGGHTRPICYESSPDKAHFEARLFEIENALPTVCGPWLRDLLPDFFNDAMQAAGFVPPDAFTRFHALIFEFLVLNHLENFWHFLTFAGWVLVSIMIAMMAGRFSEISSLAKG